MTNFKSKWLTSLLSILLVFTMISGSVLMPAYAQLGGGVLIRKRNRLP